MDDCLFCKMVKGEIPCNKLYEDDDMIVIKDINPQPKVHYLMIPKEHYKDITELTAERAVTLGRMLTKVKDIAETLDLKDGFTLAPGIKFPLSISPTTFASINSLLVFAISATIFFLSSSKYYSSQDEVMVHHPLNQYCGH